MEVFPIKLLWKSDLWGRRRDPGKRRTGPRPRSDLRSDMAHRSFDFFKKRKRYGKCDAMISRPALLLRESHTPLLIERSVRWARARQMAAFLKMVIVSAWSKCPQPFRSTTMIGDEDDDLKGRARVRAAIWV